MSWFHLVPGRVPGLASLVLWLCVPSWFPPSFLFQLGFRGLFPYFSCLSFLRKRIVFHRDFWLLLVLGSGSFLKNGAPNEFFIAHERRGNMVCCCLGSVLVYFFFECIDSKTTDVTSCRFHRKWGGSGGPELWGFWTWKPCPGHHRPGFQRDSNWIDFQDFVGKITKMIAEINS